MNQRITLAFSIGQRVIVSRQGDRDNGRTGTVRRVEAGGFRVKFAATGRNQQPERTLPSDSLTAR